MADFYVSSVAYAAITQRANSTAYGVGDIHRTDGVPTVGNERVYRCTTAGTSGVASPTWGLTAGSTTTDGTAVWTEITGESAYQSAGNWRAAAPHLDVIAKNTSGKASVAGTDNVFVASNHAEPVWTTSRDWTRLGNLRAVTVAGSTLPPGPASLTTGVVVSTSGTAGIQIASEATLYGVSFMVGDAANSASFAVGRTGISGNVVMRAGSITLNNTNATSRITLGVTGAVSTLVLEGGNITFGNAGQAINMNVALGTFRWTRGSLLGTSPTTLLLSVPNNNWLLENIDLSVLTGSIATPPGGSTSFAGSLVVRNCKVNAATTLSSNLRLRNSTDRLEANVVDTSTGLNRFIHGAVRGAVYSEHTIARNGGATDAQGNPISFRILPSRITDGAPSAMLSPATPPIYVWNTRTNAITATVEVIGAKSALLNTAQLWLEAEYLAGTSAANSLATGQSAPISGGTPTAGTASTVAWGALVSLRANSTSYTVGQAVRLASNPDRIFFCSTAGTTAVSEPAGYASAVDGGAVADGAATFTAGVRQKVAVTFTPNRAGLIAFRVRDAHAESTATSVYVDPKVTLT